MGSTTLCHDFFSIIAIAEISECSYAASNYSLNNVSPNLSYTILSTWSKKSYGLYKRGSHLAWVTGINGTCRSRWPHTIPFLPLKGKFFSSSHSKVQPQMSATSCNWNYWGNVCKQHFVFQTQVWGGRDRIAEFTKKLQIDIIQKLRHYFHWSVSTFIVQYGNNIFLKNKTKPNPVDYQFGNWIYNSVIFK